MIEKESEIGNEVKRRKGGLFLEGETTGRDRETLLLMSSKNAEIHHPVSDGHLSSRPTLEADEVDEGEEKVSEAERERRYTPTPGPLRVINGFTILEISWEQRSRIRSGVKTKGQSPPPLVAVAPSPSPPPIRSDPDFTIRAFLRSIRHDRAGDIFAATTTRRGEEGDNELGDRVYLAKAIRRQDHRERRRSEGKSGEHSGVYAQTGGTTWSSEDSTHSSVQRSTNKKKVR